MAVKNWTNVRSLDSGFTLTTGGPTEGEGAGERPAALWPGPHEALDFKNPRAYNPLAHPEDLPIRCISALPVPLHGS